MQKLRGVGIGMVFVAGCAVGGASSRFVVPPASAEQAARLTKWDYFCFHGYEAKAVEAKARALGVDGWEMVTSGGGDVAIASWCFKRPKL